MKYSQYCRILSLRRLVFMERLNDRSKNAQDFWLCDDHFQFHEHASELMRVTVPTHPPPPPPNPTMVVLDVERIQDEAPGNPRSLCLAIAFPVDQILSSTAPASQGYAAGIRRTTVNDTWWRRGGFLERQRG